MVKTWLVAAYLLASSAAHASLITTSAPGNLMFAYLGGEAGPSLQEFGIGTPAESSSIADRNMVFVIDYRLPPVVVPIVNKGYFWAGSDLDFYNLSDYNGNLFAFSSRLVSGALQPDLAVFTDRDNSLHLGGSVVQSVGDNAWILHLDDAWSYAYDDDDNELLIKVWVDQSAVPPLAIPEPGTLALLAAGVAALLARRGKGKCLMDIAKGMLHRTPATSVPGVQHAACKAWPVFSGPKIASSCLWHCAVQPSPDSLGPVSAWLR